MERRQSWGDGRGGRDEKKADKGHMNKKKVEEEREKGSAEIEKGRIERSRKRKMLDAVCF